MNEKTIYQGAFLHIIKKNRTINQHTASYEIVKHPGGVAILLIQENRILLVKQFRPAIGDYLLEIPAGKREAGEDPKECGFRELNEETGFTCQSLRFLGSFVTTPGFCDERLCLYQAIEPVKAKIRLDPDPDEDIEHIWLDLEEAYQMILEGKIDDAKTIIAIQNALLERRK